MHLNWKAKIKLRGPGFLDQLLITVVREDAKRNRRNNRLFCHIFIFGGILIGGGDPFATSMILREYKSQFKGLRLDRTNFEMNPNLPFQQQTHTHYANWPTVA